MAVALAPPWLALPDIPGANVYHAPPAGPLIVPAIVYRPDDPWIEKQTTYKVWKENYVAVCVVAANSGTEAVAALYDLALRLKAAIDQDAALAGWDWLGAGAIVETEQAGLRYLASAVRLSFSAEY